MNRVVGNGACIRSNPIHLRPKRARPDQGQANREREAHVKRMMRRVAIVGSVAAVFVMTSTAGAWALDPSIDINTKLKSTGTPRSGSTTCGSSSGPSS